jgi:hypothetical protein
MIGNYGSFSPYALTPMSAGGYLDIMVKRPVLAEDDDYLYEIEPQYAYRPDLLAFDLYENAKIWWIFALRNPNVLNDPVFNFLPGTKIFLPKASKLRVYIGT